MARLTYKAKTGRAIIQAEHPDRPGRLFTLSFPGVTAKAAEQIRGHVEHLLAARAAGSAAPMTTAAWLRDLPDNYHQKLVTVGLASVRIKREIVQLANACSQYIERRNDLKPRTVSNLKQGTDELVKYFDATRDVATITAAEAKDYRRWLVTSRKLAEATIATRIKKARQIFSDLVDRGVIKSNPFAKVETGSFANAERIFYVPASVLPTIYDACPDAEWKAIFALARIGGIRTPSETLELTWADIDWDKSAMTVRAPKMNNKARRVPLFPELVPILREAFEAAKPGAVHIVERRRYQAIGPLARKILIRAGLTVWPRVFQNLRSSRETDLVETYPIQTACAWIGNSEAVARRHYLQVRDSHFQAAIKPPETPDALRKALRTGEDSSGHEKAEGAKSSENREVGNPVKSRWESNKSEHLHGILTGSSKALRNALRDLNDALPEIRKADAERLEAAVRTAKATSRRGGRL